MNFLEADVPDPTDFPPQAEAPGLRILDASFRCGICGELYDAPVTIICGHCFCSACIRTALSNKQECPNCRRKTDEAHIRPNPALENVISTWKDARLFVLQLITDRSHQEEEPNNATTKKRKRVTERVSSPELAHASTNVPGPSRNPSSPKRAVAGEKSPSRPKKANSVINMTIPTSDADELADEATQIPTALAPRGDDPVECPMCHKRVKYRVLNIHLDNNCKDPSSSGSVAKSWSKLMSGAAGSKNGHHPKGKYRKQGSDSDDDHALPITTYTTLKDRQLKDMLFEQDLPTTGDRMLWEQRHQRWVTIFNANLDRSVSNRKSRAELRKELKKWEEDMTKKKKPPIRDLKEYQRKQKGEFARLVEAARPKKVTKTKADAQSELIPPPPPQSSSQSPCADDSIVLDSEEERC